MATRKQVDAAKRNVKKAQAAAKKKRTIANLPASTRRGLGQQAARATTCSQREAGRTSTVPKLWNGAMNSSTLP